MTNDLYRIQQNSPGGNFHTFYSFLLSHKSFKMNIEYVLYSAKV